MLILGSSPASYILSLFLFRAKKRKKNNSVFGLFLPLKAKNRDRSSRSTAPKPVFLEFTPYFAMKARKNLSCLGRQKKFLLWCRKWDSNPHGIATNGF